MNKYFRWFLILLGVLLALYPWLSNFLFEIHNGSQVATYEKNAASLTEKQYEEMLKEAREYNANLAKSKVVLTDPFSMDVEAEDTGKEYEQILALDNSGVMAYVEVPCIDVNLPVYHGTSNAVLEKGVGHLKATSVPVGGIDTHAVLTGHTGINSAKIFTDLTAVETGDTFYIHVLGEILAYEVDEVNIVEPEDTEKLRIVPGEDHVTLVTCTPYGVNSHRLLVRGTRTEYDPDIYNAMEKKDVDSEWQKAYRNAIIIAVTISLVLYLIHRFRNRKKTGA